MKVILIILGLTGDGYEVFRQIETSSWEECRILKRQKEYTEFPTSRHMGLAFRCIRVPRTSSYLPAD